MTRVRTGGLAGIWYEGSAARLIQQADGLLAAAPSPAITGTPVGIIVPHAGYQYSGATAAAAYRCVRGGVYRRAVILAPSHHERFRGAAVLDVDAFATPLGEVPVDRAALARITDQPLIREHPRAYQEEHALEIQLPLLQRALPGVAVVPLLLGDLSGDDYDEFGALLARVAGSETLFIVSCDFTHYGARFGYLPFPPSGRDAVRTQLRALDMGAIDRVLAGDRLGFEQYVAATGVTICGRVPISAFLAWYAGTGRGTLLAYTTSLDLTGDFEHSVSYAALAFTTSSR